MRKKGGRKGHWQQIQSGEYPETKTDYGDSSALNWRPENDKPLPDEKGRAESTYSKLKRKSLSQRVVKNKPLPPPKKRDFSSLEKTENKNKRRYNRKKTWSTKSLYFQSAPSTEKEKNDFYTDRGPRREASAISVYKSTAKTKIYPTFKEASEYAKENPGFKLSRTNSGLWKVVGY